MIAKVSMDPTRRRFNTIALGAMVVPLRALAQAKSSVVRVAIVGSAKKELLVKPFAAHGFVEGRNLRLDWLGISTSAAIEEMARKLVATSPDLIITLGSPATLAMQRATKEIPIVFLVGEPVRAGIVKSFSHPGGNATGISNQSLDLVAKRMELLRAIHPAARSLLVIPSEGEFGEMARSEMRVAAAKLSLRLEELPYLIGADPAAFLRVLRSRKPDTIYWSNGLVGELTPEILDHLREARIPTVYNIEEAVARGGLISLGVDIPATFARAVAIAARILRGEKPANIPVEQISSQRLAINLKTARAMGIKIPDSVLMSANLVID